jgi:plasmid stabilization system protein ParE
MPYRVERSLATDQDLAAIFDFLLESYMAFGEARGEALDLPHQGSLRPDILPGLRSVTKRRAIFYFDVDDELRLVRVLAVFFGGQDHQRAMLRRLSIPE